MKGLFGGMLIGVVILIVMIGGMGGLSSGIERANRSEAQVLIAQAQAAQASAQARAQEIVAEGQAYATKTGANTQAFSIVTGTLVVAVVALAFAGIPWLVMLLLVVIAICLTYVKVKEL